MLIEWQTLLVFIPIALALNLTPGADMMFCLGQGLKSGPKAGIAASFGIATGSFLHALAAGLGLASLIASQPWAFEIIRWAGVGYLVWLAIAALRSPIRTMQAADVRRSGILKAWRDGTLVCLFNPKIALFILALVPQFLILGAILNIGGTVINVLVGGFSGSIGRMLARNRRMAQGLQYLTSLVFLALAAKLALDRR